MFDFTIINVFKINYILRKNAFNFMMINVFEINYIL